jgi:DHA1 family bicyclomycin/chloramphenicol resistance-like MFS transporter
MSEPVSQPPAPVSAPLLLVMLIASIGLPSIGASIAIPSLAEVARDFGTDYGAVALTQTLYLLGLALPQLVYGAVSDRVGRRPTLLTGMGLYVLGSLLCMYSPTIEVLMAGRLCQAIGGCAGIALGRAILRDLYPREKAASSLAYMTMTMAAGPMLAPLLGGLIQESFGWRAIFLPLVLFSAAAFILCWIALPETHRVEEKPRWASLAHGFVTLMRHPLYRIYMIPPACLTGIYQAFLSTCSFVAAVFFPMSPVELGLWLLTSVGGFSFGNFLSGRFGQRIGIDRLIKLGAIINLASTLVLAGLLAGGWLTTLGFFGAMVVLNIGHGLSMPNGIASATGVIPGLLGSAAGLTGFLQMATAAVFSIGVGMLVETSVWFLFGTMVALGVVALAAALRSPAER